MVTRGARLFFEDICVSWGKTRVLYYVGVFSFGVYVCFLEKMCLCLGVIRILCYISTFSFEKIDV